MNKHMLINSHANYNSMFRVGTSTIITFLFVSSIFIGCIGEPDIDSDNVSDKKDNCVEVFNPDQLDYDGDNLSLIHI